MATKVIYLKIPFYSKHYQKMSTTTATINSAEPKKLTKSKRTQKLVTDSIASIDKSLVEMNEEIVSASKIKVKKETYSGFAVKIAKAAVKNLEKIKKNLEKIMGVKKDTKDKPKRTSNAGLIKPIGINNEASFKFLSDYLPAALKTDVFMKERKINRIDTGAAIRNYVATKKLEHPKIQKIDKKTNTKVEAEDKKLFIPDAELMAALKMPNESLSLFKMSHYFANLYVPKVIVEKPKKVEEEKPKKKTTTTAVEEPATKKKTSKVTEEPPAAKKKAKAAPVEEEDEEEKPVTKKKASKKRSITEEDVE